MSIMRSSSTYSQSTQQQLPFLAKSTCDLLYPPNPPPKDTQDSLILLPTFFPNIASSFKNNFFEHPTQMSNPAFLLYEPIKKAKLDNRPPEILNSCKEASMAISQFKSSLGTIDEVFNSTIEPIQAKNQDQEENADEDLNLSLSSSVSSSKVSEDSDIDLFSELDGNDDIVEQSQRNLDSKGSQTLTIENTFFNDKKVSSHNKKGTVAKPFGRELASVPLNDVFSRKSSQDIAESNDLFFKNRSCKISKQYSFNSAPESNQGLENLNAKRSFPFDEDIFKSKVPVKSKIDSQFNKQTETIIISECEDEGDSDSNLTGSTGLGLDSRNPSVVEGLTGKLHSKLAYMGESGVFSEFKIGSNDIKDKSRKSLKYKNERKFLQTSAQDPSNRQGRKPNKLQALRHDQNNTNEEEDLINKHDFLEYKSQTQALTKPKRRQMKLNQDVIDLHSEQLEENMSIGPEYQAVIPPFSLFKKRTPRVKVAPIWTPDLMKNEDVQIYTNKLARIIEEPTISEEKALSVLRMFDLNMSMTFEDIKHNLQSYKAMLQVKLRKHRRCATLFACYT